MSRAKRPAENAESRAPEAERPSRRSFVEDTKDILTVRGKDENYVYRIVNDDPGRVHRMREAGYEVVQDEGVTIGDANIVSESGTVGTITVDRRHGVKGILMRIRKEWYEEDQRAREKLIAKREAALFRTEKEADGRYGKITQETPEQ